MSVDSKELALHRIAMTREGSEWVVDHETRTRKPGETFRYQTYIDAAAKVKEIVLAEAERQVTAKPA